MTLAKAIASSLSSLGVRVATHVPGHGATQTFEQWGAVVGAHHAVISFHEEAAYAVAHGAALCGARSACIIKSHGLTKAMNAVMDSLSCGVTAGMVNFIFEDKGGSHSDNIIEIIPMIQGAEMPHKISTPASIVEDIVMAYKESERLQLPYTLVLDSEFINDACAAVGAHHANTTKYHRDVMRHLVCPIFATYQRDVLLAKLRGEDFDAVARPPMPRLPESLPPAYQKAVEPYLPMFSAFKELMLPSPSTERGQGRGVDFVCGDAGVSTLSAFPRYEIAHAALYMGGSIPTIVGAYLAGMKRSWAFIGDFSFISAGHYGLIEALLRKAPIKVLIYANGRAQTTGGQPLDLSLLERLLRGYEEYVRRIEDPFDRDAILPVLREANDADELRIIVAKYS